MHQSRNPLRESPSLRNVRKPLHAEFPCFFAGGLLARPEPMFARNAHTVRSFAPGARRKGVAVALATFLGALFVAALLLPKTITTRSSYCVRCALHVEDTERVSPLSFRGMPGERLFVSHTRVERAAVLHQLLAPVVGPHEHVFLDPAAFVPPTSPRKLTAPDDFQQAVAVAEVTDLDQLEASPHLLALLDEAMHDDPSRTVRFVQRILDPHAHVASSSVALLDRNTSWSNRWEVVDAFFDVYRCNANEASVSCHMKLETTDLLVLARTATSLHEGGIDYPRWVPPGMEVPAKKGKTVAVVTN